MEALLFVAFAGSPAVDFAAFEPPAAVVVESTYASVYGRVLAGERVTFTAPLAGFSGPPGEYTGFLLNGSPVMERAAREVAVPRTFPGFDASHNCPECGRSQFGVSGRGPTPGSHTHTCSAGHSWWHSDGLR